MFDDATHAATDLAGLVETVRQDLAAGAARPLGVLTGTHAADLAALEETGSQIAALRR